MNARGPATLQQLVISDSFIKVFATTICPTNTLQYFIMQ